ncbi:MAG: FAD-binding oxidoreductase [Rhodobiaceae bacterium]|nr:FAD-binding oxidoreductase [Rhodobiaceae bacterium]
MTRIIPDSVSSAGEIPARVDVVVIGGGIVGTSTALSLAEKGVTVALCEKGLIGAEQSGRNWGWVRQMGRDPIEIPLSMLSMERWREMNERTGEETGFRQTGIAYLCRTDREEAEYEAWLNGARDYGLDSKLLRKEELRQHLPGMANGFTAALHTSTDGRAEPLKASPAIANAAIRAGAHVLTGCAVRTIERSAGRVSGVVTEKGSIACTSVVLAGGAWSRLFAGNMGIDFPQLKVLSTAARSTPVTGVPDMPVGADNFAFRRRLDGGFTLTRRNVSIAPVTPDSFRLFADFLPNLVKSWRELKIRVGNRFIQEWQTPRSWTPDEITPFEQVRILDPMPIERYNRQGLSHLAHAFPAFKDARIVQTWAGLIDVTPDAVPVISAINSIPGFYLASGFSGHGFGIGPGAGQLMAEIVTGAKTSVDPTPFRFDRLQRDKAA